eukprot:TRINITY_DN112142_c0_g1_i1.p1 TRINITY_DN112142_c0_g1~~TRINITY_DN112142_c0_g1_i1.p1  ORF type:complete len:486 (+),score=123.17 TRINITY_DN112142_c0_g1_i1:86-1543(+)
MESAFRVSFDSSKVVTTIDSVSAWPRVATPRLGKALVAAGTRAVVADNTGGRLPKNCLARFAASVQQTKGWTNVREFRTLDSSFSAPTLSTLSSTFGDTRLLHERSCDRSTFTETLPIFVGTAPAAPSNPTLLSSSWMKQKRAKSHWSAHFPDKLTLQQTLSPTYAATTSTMWPSTLQAEVDVRDAERLLKSMQQREACLKNEGGNDLFHLVTALQKARQDGKHARVTEKTLITVCKAIYGLIKGCHEGCQEVVQLGGLFQVRKIARSSPEHPELQIALINILTEVALQGLQSPVSMMVAEAQRCLELLRDWVRLALSRNEHAVVWGLVACAYARLAAHPLTCYNMQLLGFSEELHRAVWHYEAFPRGATLPMPLPPPWAAPSEVSSTPPAFQPRLTSSALMRATTVMGDLKGPAAEGSPMAGLVRLTDLAGEGAADVGAFQRACDRETMLIKLKVLIHLLAASQAKLAEHYARQGGQTAPESDG